MTDVFVREVVRLHQVIEGWTTGQVLETADAFAGFADALEPDFVIINPDGQTETRDSVVGRFRQRHGARSGVGFQIGIAEATLRQTVDHHGLVTYHEIWTKHGGPAGTILASAWLHLNDGTPGGVGWLHLHETWLTPPPA